MSSQSLTTPAMFIVRADVFPISRKTAMFSAAVTAEMPQPVLLGIRTEECDSCVEQMAGRCGAPKAAVALLSRTAGLMTTAGSFRILGSSKQKNGSSRNPKHAGEM
jgi:hypothetical protein